MSKNWNRKIVSLIIVGLIASLTILIYEASLIGDDTTFIPSNVELEFFQHAFTGSPKHKELVINRILSKRALPYLDIESWKDWEDVINDFNDVPVSKFPLSHKSNTAISTTKGPQKINIEHVLSVTGWRIYKIYPMEGI